MSDKPTPDKLHIDFWNKNPHHPARMLVDELLETRSAWVVSQIDKYWWYEIALRHLANVLHIAAPTFEEAHKRRRK